MKDEWDNPNVGYRTIEIGPSLETQLLICVIILIIVLFGLTIFIGSVCK